MIVPYAVNIISSAVYIYASIGCEKFSRNVQWNSIEKNAVPFGEYVSGMPFVTDCNQCSLLFEFVQVSLIEVIFT